MSTTYTKQLLSASITGRQIALNGTTAPGVLLHNTLGVLNNFDEVWVYATNNGTAPVSVITCWGSSTTADQSQVIVSPTSRQLVADGRILASGSVSAFMGSSGTLCIDGFVNRITSTSSALTLSIIDDWNTRVIRNGGAVPSVATKTALTTFVDGLIGAGILSKMVGLNCFVPDSLIACMTPLIRGGFEPWINNNFVLGDLTVNGLKGDASVKTLNTGINPGALLGASGLMGVSYYAQAVTATGFDYGCYNGNQNLIGAAKYTDNNTYGYNSGSSGANVITTASPGAGFYTDLRVSTTDHRTFFAKSSTPFAQLGATDTLAASGNYLSQPMYVFCVNLTSGATQLPCSNTLSFIAMHNNMTASDCSNLFSLVHALRITLGGGFV